MKANIAKSELETPKESPTFAIVDALNGINFAANDGVKNHRTTTRTQNRKNLRGEIVFIIKKPTRLFIWWAYGKVRIKPDC
jgi:hypothetical protein